MELVIYESSHSEIMIDRFIEAMNDRDLVYNSFDLAVFGLDATADLEPAVKRAMNACLVSQLPIRKHFKTCFIDHQGQLSKVWKLSETAVKLVMLNADPANPAVAKLQMDLIDRPKNIDKNHFRL